MSEVSARSDEDRNGVLSSFAQIVGGAHVLVAEDELATHGADWGGDYRSKPIAVCRPRTAQEIAALVRICGENGIAVVPQGGRTGLCGGGVPTQDRASLVITTSRMNTIRHIDTAARTMTVEAGVILEKAQQAAVESGLTFPLTFGAKGSCTIGGALATNAGGSNVVRYGMTRDLCVGIEAVMPDGSIINALGGLRKDNTGYDFKNLLIGSEGTLGIISAAMFKLSPQPRVRATAFLSVSSVSDAIEILNRLQDETGGAVETFEYMPRPAVELICRQFPDKRPPLDPIAETGIFLEIASTREDDAALGEGGSSLLQHRVLAVLEALMDQGTVLNAMIAQSEKQRGDLWSLREAVLESIQGAGPAYFMDISLPLAKLEPFLIKANDRVGALGFCPITVGHLGDGNLHFALTASRGRSWKDLPLQEAKLFALDLLQEMGGSFSAEHGIGQSKIDLMQARKEPSQLDMMRRIKSAIDPEGLMNPGKLIPISANAAG